MNNINKVIKALGGLENIEFVKFGTGEFTTSVFIKDNKKVNLFYMSGTPQIFDLYLDHSLTWEGSNRIVIGWGTWELAEKFVQICDIIY